MPLGLIATKWHITHVAFNLLLYMIFATIIITIYDIGHRLIFRALGGVLVCFFSLGPVPSGFCLYSLPFNTGVLLCLSLIEGLGLAGGFAPSSITRVAFLAYAFRSAEVLASLCRGFPRRFFRLSLFRIVRGIEPSRE